MSFTRWAILAIAIVLCLSSCDAIFKQTDLESFVSTGLTMVAMRSSAFSSATSIGSVPSGTPVTCTLAINNPKSFAVTYTLGWNVDSSLFTTLPPTSPTASDATHLSFSFTLDSTKAERKTIIFTLGKYVASINKTYDKDSFSVVCESPPDPPSQLSTVMDSSQKSILAFLLPTGTADKTLSKAQITWTKTGASTSTSTSGTYSISSLETAPSSNPFSSNYNCYFQSSDVVATYGYTYSVVLINADGIKSNAATISSGSCGTTGITINPPSTTYQGLGFPASASILQGHPFALETANSTFDAIGSGWTWYIDGAAQSQTSQRFLLPPATTSAMLGVYNIAASVKGTDGVTYSGRTALTVNRLAALNLSNTLSVLAGGASGSTDGTGTGAKFSSPIGITTDGVNLYVVDNVNNDIRKIVIATGVVTTLVSSGLNGPNDITTDGTYLYVTNQNANTILKVAIATGIVTTLAGSGSSGSSDGTGTGSSFNFPGGIATDGTNLYVCDMGNNEIRQVVIATGRVTTIVGSSAGLNSPYGITTDGTNLYICDSSNEVIRKVMISSPTVTTLAGTIGTFGNVNATGTGAEFSAPLGIVSDGTNLYVADKGNSSIRQIVISSGVVTTLLSSSSGVDRPYRITTDGTSLYFVQPNTYKVQKIQ